MGRGFFFKNTGRGAIWVENRWYRVLIINLILRYSMTKDPVHSLLRTKLGLVGLGQFGVKSFRSHFFIL